MTDLQEDLTFDCPHCGEPNALRVDLTAGKRQKFVVDCEVCCHPIVIQLEADETGILELSAEKE